jgi:hypothetical protein
VNPVTHRGKAVTRHLLRRIAGAADRFCAAALPHLQMGVLSLMAVVIMETAPVIGPLRLVIR